MCCIISGEPVADSKGKRRTFNGAAKFQVSMMDALWCPDGYKSCGWFCGQFIPATCGITQCLLRRKVLNYDMTKYSCFQGYFNICCCIKAGSCGESSCPDLCLFCESCVCNSIAISASRMYVMEKYDLQSDPCDYRLIRINNCLQMLSCVCDILAIFIADLRQLARIIDWIADLMFHCVSGCMTAQVAHEVNYQNSLGSDAVVTQAIPVNTGKY
mmetsp:Transcript_19102/g.27329  ORF Transcript_19102/g.27329 Transcript_19102/m.27329 type:complete len:214 (+) Transcript_19102:27-668(+)